MYKIAAGNCVVHLQVDLPVASPNGPRQVQVESWPQAKQQRVPQAGADLDAVVR